MRNSIKLLIGVGVILGSASCAATVVTGAAAGTATVADSRGGGNVIKDQDLEHKINSVLDAQVPNGSYTVASYAQNILLAGQVPSAKDKDKAEAATHSVVGVKKVWNYLTIGENEGVSAVSQDAYLTSTAKTRLIAQKGVNANNIKVVTSNQVVYLLGHKSGTSLGIKSGIAGIKTIDGVKDVVNLIK